MASQVYLGLRVREVPVDNKAIWELLAGMVMMDSKAGRAKKVWQDLLEHLVIRCRVLQKSTHFYHKLMQGVSYV